MKLAKILRLCVLLFAAGPVLGNNPGGTNGSSTPVTMTSSGGNVTMANGIVSIVCATSGAQINQINYTYKNSTSGTTTTQLLSGGNDGGKLYWENGGFGSGTYAYTPVAAGPNYAEMDLLSTSDSNGTMAVIFSMLQGSPGFYVTAIWSHRTVDIAMATGETRDNIYAGSMFNWMCVDAMRNRLMEVSGGNSVGVYGAPQEVSLWTSGLYQGRYEDKYKYSADFGEQRVWGWASVNASTGSGGKNVGLWNILGSIEYYNGGPMKRELMSHIGTTILNMTRGGHYGGGSDTSFAAGEVWTHCFGPWFIYCNNVTNTLAAPQAAAALWADAQAQAAAEAPAWPYAWLTNDAYSPAANRGAVSGQIVINDPDNPNASASNLYVGVVQQPSTQNAIYDFQDWSKPFQFWVKSGSNGLFTISNVIAGTNYTFYAFGPGAPGMFMSQHQTGGNPDLIYNLPATPFSITVAGGATNNLGVVTWTPTRVGPTVFEIGFPNRTSAHKFRHSDDWWVADIGPNANVPSPIWSKFLEYPFDFPNGVNYTVGQSRWTTDWNYVQPAVFTISGGTETSTSTISFNLPAAPAGGADGSIYIATSSDFSGPVVVSVNGNNLGSASGVTSTPNGNGSGGYNPAFNGGNDESDSSVREGIHGCFGDERITFPGTLLKSGKNTLTITMSSGSGDNHAMYDYIRLELAGYVPPAPAAVTAWPGNNCNLLSWPLTPGATSYNILRSTNSGGAYSSIATGVTSPVCGSGSNNNTWLDTNALNGNTYYYAVQSVNPVNASANSPQSAGTTPLAAASAAVPAAPTGLTASVGHTNVALTWNASPGANYYSVWRSILVNTGGGTSNALNTNILNNITTTCAYTDATVTDGTYYSFFVTAANAAGTSPASAPVNATPLPPPPAGAPAGLTVNSVAVTTNSQQPTLSWDAVPGAVGYVLYHSTNPNGPFTFADGYSMALSENRYTDTLALGSTNYYVVVAMNAAGASANSGIVSTSSLTNSPTNSTATTLALTTGTSPCAYGASLTFQATVIPAPPNGETVNFYSGTAGIGAATTVGGVATLTIANLPYSASAQAITAAYLGDSTNLPSASTALSQTVTQGTLTYTATPASRAYGAANPTLAGAVTGFVAGDTLGSATTGTLAFTTTATPSSPAGSYAITGSGLAADNYNFAQAAANATALTVTNVFLAATSRPILQPVTLSAGGLNFTGANGSAYALYYLLASSNLAAPLSNWIPVATNLFDARGNFDFTNRPSPTVPQQFYILESP